VRLYGDFHGVHSLAQVAQGFASVFPDSFCYDLKACTNELDEDFHHVGGADSEDAIFLGKIGDLPKAKYRGKHSHWYVMIAPNSDQIGKGTEKILNEHADTILVPSLWAKHQIDRLLPHKPTMVVPHGISSVYRPPEEKHAENRFTVLHLSSSIRQRKGTEELIEAWKLADLPDSQLRISVPSEAMFSLMDLIEDSGAKGISLKRRLDFSPAMMVRAYWASDFVCQPSRGEGFGLVPVEARACGVPVIATDCTGHSQHMEGPGTVVIPTGALEPIDDFSDSMAPSLKTEDIAECLVDAYKRRMSLSNEAKDNAAKFRKEWSWENQLEEFRNEF